MIDVRNERRNFPGYREANVFSLTDMQGGDSSGTTDTDAKTHEMSEYEGSGYTNIYSAMHDLDPSGGGEVLSIEALGSKRIKA